MSLASCPVNGKSTGVDLVFSDVVGSEDNGRDECLGLITIETSLFSMVIMPGHLFAIATTDFLWRHVAMIVFYNFG